MHKGLLTVLLAVPALGTILGCEAPRAVKVPVQSNVGLQNAVVVWATDEPTVGAVRYGLSAGNYDRIAYPASVARGDKVFVLQHRVPLLNVAEGETIYYQVMDTAEDGRGVTSREFSGTVSSRPPLDPLLTWTMVDVGFGDSHFLTMPTTGNHVLIDSGERQDWPNVDKFLQSRSITRLDYVIGTHIHADHMGGMVGGFSDSTQGVLRAYEIGMFIDSPDKSASRTLYGEVQSILEDFSIPADTVRVGDTDQTHPELAWDPEVSIRVINAGFGSSIGGSSSGDWLNNDSIVLQITYGDVDLIMGGDAEGPVESHLTTQFGETLESEVLKVHHHGHRDTSVPGFLDVVNPRVGLVPIASYESFVTDPLPHSDSMERIRDRHIHIYASDRAEALGIQLSGDNGFNITMFTDGKSYEVLVAPSESRHFRSGTIRPFAEDAEVERK